MEELRSMRMVTTIKTPYQRNGEIDFDSYDNLVNMQLEKGVQDILVGAAAGEGYKSTLPSRDTLISQIRRSFGNRIKIISYIGRQQLGYAHSCNEMDDVMYINPPLRLMSESLIDHYNGRLLNGPWILFNLLSSYNPVLENLSEDENNRRRRVTSTPTLSSYEIPLRVVEKLSENPNLVGIMENKRVKMYASTGVHVWTGKDGDNHKARWECGAIRVYSLAANLVPGLMNQLTFEGKNPSLNIKLKPLFDWIFHVPTPMAWTWSDWDSPPAQNPLITALAQLGVIKPVFRKPYVPVPVKKRRKFADLVEEIGRDHFVGEKDVQILDDRDFVVICWWQ